MFAQPADAGILDRYPAVPPRGGPGRRSHHEATRRKWLRYTEDASDSKLAIWLFGGLRHTDHMEIKDVMSAAARPRLRMHVVVDSPSPLLAFSLEPNLTPNQQRCFAPTVRLFADDEQSKAH